MAIEEFDGYFIKPSLLRSFANRLFPEGNLQEIKANSTSQRDYNINSTKDMVENVDLGILSNPLINRLIPFNLAKEIMAPGTAGAMSLFYDGGQAYQRMEDGSGLTGYGNAFMAENPFSSLVERSIGAAGPFADRLSNIYGFTPTFGGPQGIFAQGANFFKDRFNNNANAQGIESLIIPNAPGSGYTPDPSNYNSQPRPAGTSQPGSGYQAGASQYTKPTSISSPTGTNRPGYSSNTSKPKGGQISKKSTSYKNKAR